jgi:hypothetical protein
MVLIQDGMWVHARAGIRSISSGCLVRLRILNQFIKEKIVYESTINFTYPGYIDGYRIGGFSPGSITG